MTERATICVDLADESRVCAVTGPYVFAGFRAANLDEIWRYREQEALPNCTVHDPGLNYDD